MLAVQNKDPNVKFIETGSNSDRQRKTISLNETVIFTWDKVISNDINSIAFDKDNLQLYEYRFNPESPTVLRMEDLRWYPIKKE